MHVCIRVCVCVCVVCGVYVCAQERERESSRARERERGGGKGVVGARERTRNFTRISETNFSGALRSRQAGVVNF